jgi:hypothetical protein
MFPYYPKNALSTAFISCLVFTVIIGGLLAASYSIYKRGGWNKMRRYIWALGILLSIGAVFNPDDLSDPIMLGYLWGYAFAFAGYFFFIGYHMLKCQSHKEEIDKYIESEIEAMLPAPDEELLKIKKTMGYRRDDPNYEKMNGYLEREELTRRWKIKKRLELRDPFMWKEFR